MFAPFLVERMDLRSMASLVINSSRILLYAWARELLDLHTREVTFQKRANNTLPASNASLARLENTS